MKLGSVPTIGEEEKRKKKRDAKPSMRQLARCSDDPSKLGCLTRVIPNPQTSCTVVAVGTCPITAPRTPVEFAQPFSGQLRVKGSSN
jgi:hypothetical protein